MTKAEIIAMLATIPDDEPLFLVRASDAGAQAVIEWWVDHHDRVARKDEPEKARKAQESARSGLLAKESVYKWNAKREAEASRAFEEAATPAARAAARSALSDVIVANGGDPLVSDPLTNKDLE